MAKLVYIGGYGRSGSTLLEYLLTSHPSVVACGEIRRSLQRLHRRRDRVCTCGQTLANCPVWGLFEQKLGNLKGRSIEELTLALLDCVSPNYEVMVDSSKTAWGSFSVPSHLVSRLGENFLLVHLVRDPRGVSWSSIRTPWRPKKKNPRPPLPLITALRSAIGWMTANLACEVFAWRHPECYMRVRYEDLAQSPSRIVDAILQRSALTPPPSLIANSMGNRHQLHGNAMRFRPLALSDLKEDVAWKRAMPKGFRGLVGGLCWPLSRRYGY